MIFIDKQNLRISIHCIVAYIDIAETRLNTILVDLNAEWFKSMFGEGPENTIVVASL